MYYIDFHVIIGIVHLFNRLKGRVVLSVRWLAVHWTPRFSGTRQYIGGQLMTICLNKLGSSQSLLWPRECLKSNLTKLCLCQIYDQYLSSKNPYIFPRFPLVNLNKVCHLVTLFCENRWTYELNFWGQDGSRCKPADFL